MRSSELTQRIAAELRAGIGRKQIRQADLASALGISQAAMSARLRGQQSLSLDELVRACAVLEVDVAELLAVARAAA